ncbi:MAG TPA: hypothetical protein VFK89_05425 [Actinomycetota bacterium]|nr:hypothetical protein [Actinomycetota bacterium]
MHVVQCPKCELRLATPSELQDHLSTDHPDFRSAATSVEDDLLAACHCHAHHRTVSRAVNRRVA